MFANIAKRSVVNPSLSLKAANLTKSSQMLKPSLFQPNLCRMFSTGFGKPCSETSIGVPTETFKDEKRVALSPEGVKRLVKDGFTINVQRGAGTAAGFLDKAYEAEGAKIVENAFKSDIVFKVRPPSMEEVPSLEKDSGLISYLYPRIS